MVRLKEDSEDVSLIQTHRKSIIFLFCYALAFVGFLRMNKFISAFVWINPTSQHQITQNRTGTTTHIADADEVNLKSPTAENTQNYILNIQTTNDDMNQDDIPEQMRLPMLDFTLGDIQVIDQLNHFQGGQIPAIRICNTPKLKQPKDFGYDITGRCCIGAASNGDHQAYFGWLNNSCVQNITAYEKVWDLAVKELNSIPINNAQFLQCDICRVVQIVSTLKHRRISIVGDSLQRQLFNGIECELFRRGFNITDWKIEEWEEEPQTAWTGKCSLVL